VIAQEREHEAAAPEHEREQDLPSGAPDDGVHLDDPGVWRGGHERLEVGVGAADAALRVDLVLHGFAGPRLDHADTGHVAVLRAQQAARDVAVDGLLVDPEKIRVINEDVVDGLPGPYERTHQRVEGAQFVLFDIGTFARSDEQMAVVLMCEVVVVIPLAQDADRLPDAPVADVWRRIQLLTSDLLKGRADQVAELADRAAPCAVRLVHTQLAPVACLPVYAAVREPPVCALVAEDAPGVYLPCDGRVVLADLRGDLLDGQAVPQPVFDLQTLCVRDMFVLSHDGSFRLRPASLPDTRYVNKRDPLLAD